MFLELKMEKEYLQNDLETFDSLSSIVFCTFPVLQLRIDGKGLQKVRDLMHNFLMFVENKKLAYH